MDHLRAWVKQHGKNIRLTKNMMVFQMGEQPTHLYFLEKGWVKIAQEAEDGQAITLSLRKSGDIFGLAEILAHSHHRARYAFSLTDVSLYVISVEQLQLLLAEQPGLWQQLSRMMAERLIETQNFVKALTNLSVPQRLGWFLQNFAQQKGTYYVIELPLTHEEISYLVGCSRQKITSYLNRWRSEGFITYERGKIEVLNTDAIFPTL